MPREERQAGRHAGVPGQIDQNVGLVGADGGLDGARGLPHEVAPDGGERLQSLRNRVLSEVIVIEIDFELGRIEVTQQRLEEERARMRAQIGGKNPNPQATARRRRVGKIRHRKSAERAAIGNVLGKKLGPLHLVDVAEGKEPVAARLMTRGLEFEVALVSGDGLGQAMQLMQRLGATVVALRIRGIGGDGFFVASERFRVAAGQAERQAVVVPTLGKIRLQRDCPLVAHEGFREAILNLQTVGQMVPNLSRLVVAGQGRAQDRLGILRSTDGDQRHAQALRTRDIVRRQFVSASE